jgi:tRNA G18 (ribose-2'-O)-methylase SpoU
MRGYFGIGIENIKTEMNIGTLWRSAKILDASFVFTIGKRYKKQSSDTIKAIKHMPLYNFDCFDSFYNNLPYNCKLVGVELLNTAIEIKNYAHPERAIYLLGAEDHGLTNKAIDKCHDIIQLPGLTSLNVAVAGSIVMYDRFIKTK